jgi:hypothetical protein
MRPRYVLTVFTLNAIPSAISVTDFPDAIPTNTSYSRSDSRS